ncbi:MAG: SGNH/GDSL hydrolase family protein [Chloroflexi bacterium]|nr:SGNH/GDSL hydrolase family protein [Chloroflexota bacterium]
MQENVRDIYARGITLGRNPHTFSKIGDSVVLTPIFWPALTATIITWAFTPIYSPPSTSLPAAFSRYGQAAKVGLSFRTLYELGWPDEEYCKPEEDVVACEIRMNNPSIMLIRLGTNDQVPAAMEADLRKLLGDLIAQGIVPILSTKNDRFDDEKNINNQIIRDLAAEYAVPFVGL